ncbi:MAG: (d)CMP kinase [Pseudomonadales bacterium]
MNTNDATGETVPVVTIDGPSGSGKGAVTAQIAEGSGFHVLDSGALYRLVGLAARRAGVRLDDERALAEIATHLDTTFQPEDGEEDWAVYLGTEIVTALIRTDEAGVDASLVSQFSGVRGALIERQRAFKAAPGLIADGRDMGTIVFPDATLKIFLTASAEQRANRRYKQLKNKGMDVNFAALLESIQARDVRDMTRSVAPLVPAEDSVVIDSSELSLSEVVQRVRSLMIERSIA